MTQADVLTQLQHGNTTVFSIAVALDETLRRVEQKLWELERKGKIERSALGGYRLVGVAA